MSVDLASEEEQLRGDTGGSAEDLRLATAEECLELHEQTDRMRVVAAAWGNTCKQVHTKLGW